MLVATAVPDALVDAPIVKQQAADAHDAGLIVKQQAADGRGRAVNQPPSIALLTRIVMFLRQCLSWTPAYARRQNPNMLGRFARLSGAPLQMRGPLGYRKQGP